MGCRMTRRRGLTRGQLVILLAVLGGGLVGASSLVQRWGVQLRRNPNVAAEAKDYLRERNVKPLDVDLDTLLAESLGSSVSTLRHPLLAQPAPDFRLSDYAGQQHTLSNHLARGPVVLVFYYGYYCNHCVSQLFALNGDISKFHELGAEVLAISADAPEDTAKKFAKYGMFTFPVLSDPDNKLAAAYTVFAPAGKTSGEVLLHGTFVIDRDGIVRWCHYAHEPFTDNATLLVEVAKIQGRLALDDD